MANWIKLFFNVDKNSDFLDFEDALKDGKKGRRARRTAEDVALAQVTRLYMMLGQTKEGKVDMTARGDRLLAERAMREDGDDLILMFDRMAAHGIINREYWTGLNVVTTTNAQQQAAARQRSKDKSNNANEAKRKKAEERARNNL